MSAAFQTYDFTLGAGQSARIPVYGKYVRVQTAIGAVNLRGDFGYLKNLLPGQGQAINAFSYVIVEDASGAANAGSIIVGEEGFVDNRMILGSASAIALDAPTQAALNPKSTTTYFGNAAALVANTPLTIFTPATNVNGAWVTGAELHTVGGAGRSICSVIAKTAAPANIIDGQVIVMSKIIIDGASPITSASLNQPKLIPAGWGLYLIAAAPTTVDPANNQNVSYKLL